MVELLIACAVVALLVGGVGLPALAKSRMSAARTTCVSNLKSISLAFRMWANDCEAAFPFAVSTNASGKQPGTREYIETGQIWRHFVAMRMELNTPKVLKCPSDAARLRVTEWTNFNSNAGLSYFVGFDGSETQPSSILMGDRNLAVPINPNTRVARLTARTPVAWGPDIHKRVGNIGIGDGSVSQLSLPSLRIVVGNALMVSTGGVVRLGIP